MSAINYSNLSATMRATFESCDIGDTLPTLTIAIGRNVDLSRHTMGDYVTTVAGISEGSATLSDDSWTDFQRDILWSISEDIAADSSLSGVSSFAGIREESHVFQWFGIAPLTPLQFDRLTATRKWYGQDSIAVTYAVPTFI